MMARQHTGGNLRPEERSAWVDRLVKKGKLEEGEAENLFDASDCLRFFLRYHFVLEKGNCTWSVLQSITSDGRKEDLSCLNLLEQNRNCACARFRTSVRYCAPRLETFACQIKSLRVSAKLCTSPRKLSTSELCWNNQWFLWGTHQGSGWSAGLAGWVMSTSDL